MPTVSVVIPTYQRPDACERALRSVLSQEPAPLEVLVCDNGSGDDTESRFRAWAEREPLVEYARIPVNSGTPAPARNEGVRRARGEWVAFLDDDDEWLPGKLAAQLEHTAEADVIGTNAVTTDGDLYFPDAPKLRHPDRAEILAVNPMINSSAMVRRELLLAAGGVPLVRGLEDYAGWLELADRGARFTILGEPLVRYTTHGDDRVSSAPLRGEVAAARLAWRRALKHPGDGAARRAALNKTAAAVSAVRRRLAQGAS
ncbi:MAG: hypothetical protein QOI80_803 [Solirubrobacteraceae bacterium]|nr:hypothetical protein [Solirubrobacteraceae bacterium]